MLNLTIAFYHLASGTPIKGFLNAEPADVPCEDAQEMLDKLQRSFGKGDMSYITLYTHDNLKSEITLPSAVLQGCTMSSCVEKV